MKRLRRISYLAASILLISSCAGYKEASPDDDWRPAYLGPIKCQTVATFYHIAKPQLETRGVGTVIGEK
jgi:PBP1b-binding outer membrane lipoprotein LpoB